MILEFSKDNKTLMLISLIFVILSGLGLIISIIRLIITKKHYINNVDALITKICELGESEYTHSDYSSNTIPLSKTGGKVYILKYTIDGTTYESKIQKLSPHKEIVGDTITLKYHKDKPNLVRYNNYFDYICLLIIVGMFFITFGIILTISLI